MDSQTTTEARSYYCCICSGTFEGKAAHVSNSIVGPFHYCPSCWSKNILPKPIDPQPITMRADIEFLERWVDMYCESNRVGAAILRLTKHIKEQLCESK